MRATSFLVMAISAIFCLSVSATIINIPDDYPTIRQGINASDDGDTVLVQPDTYEENILFAGRNIVLGSLFLTTEDTSYISQTIIDGTQVSPVVRFVSGENRQAMLIGFTIQNGNSQDGGGIYCGYANPTITNNIIKDNSAMDDGGGIECWHSSPVIEYNVIRNNYCDDDGGGISCQYSNAVIKNNIIEYNIANSVGGGVFTASYVVINDNLIRDNQAGSGAGIYCWYCSPAISNNEITGNIVLNLGGGICCWGSGPDIFNNQISFNTANYGGGIICTESSYPSIFDNMIFKNSSDQMGGGILTYISDPSIHHNVIFSNSADSTGGGVQFYISGGNMWNNTIAKNQADTCGGGICIFDSNPSIVNTIFWADTSAHDCEISVLSGSPSFTYCNIQGSYPGDGNINSDPLFVDLENDGYYLLQDSPCIDAGCPDYPLDPDSTRCDIGAFYYDQSTGIDGLGNLPLGFHLNQNYPNPFNASTIIKYELPQQSQVTIDIYDILGRKVTTLKDGLQPAGHHLVIWDARDLSSGVYFYQFQASDYTQTGKMILLK